MRHAHTRLALIAALLILALAGCGPQIAQQKAQDDLLAAQQQAQLGRIPQARLWADRAIAAAPKDLSTYIAASGADPLGGTVHLHGIVDPGEGKNGVFSSVGDDADVVVYMARAARAFPDNSAPLLVEADAQARLGDTTGQRATAAKAAALLEHGLTAPGGRLGADVMTTLAQAYWDSGDPAKGAATFRRVIATYPHDPNVSQAYNGLAYDYAVADDRAHLPEALAMAKTALGLAQKLDIPDEQRDSLVADIQDRVGWVQYRMGDFQNALANVQMGVNAHPRSAEGRYHLAMIYKALGSEDDARIELAYATRLNPGYADARRELAALSRPSPAPKTADSHV